VTAVAVPGCTGCRQLEEHAPERLSFDLPPALEASGPPEARGIARDGVRMMVARRADLSVVHSTFTQLPRFLDPGDLVVINTSATLAAAVDAIADDGTEFVIHLSTQLDPTRWVVEPRQPAGRTTTRWDGPLPSVHVQLVPDGGLIFDEPYDDAGRLWTATLDLPRPPRAWLGEHGRPIRYQYVDHSWPLRDYQNVYATEPGSAEMPSAGRPFTFEVITKLVAAGIAVTPLLLHTGVASLEANELPYPERVRVPDFTAERVNDAHAHGHRVIAVGTTVVRGLETATDERGLVHGYDGWTDLVITPERGVRAVDGLLTGWHEPEASHLLMLEAVAGRDLLERSYAASLAEGYLWHEFGDVELILR